MVVQGDFQPPAAGDEPDLTAGESDRIDIDLRIGLDPRHACAHAEALGRGDGRTGEQRSRHDDGHDDVAHGRGAGNSHSWTPRPGTAPGGRGEKCSVSLSYRGGRGGTSGAVATQA